MIIFSVIIIAIISFTLGLYFITKNNSNLLNQPVDLEECHQLKFSGDNKINLLFFSSKSVSEKYMNFLLKTSPFDKNINEFNFYYIDSYKPECEIYQEQAILCRGKEIINKAASCPYDFIFVIKENEDKFLRSAALNNIATINSKHTLSVLTHEFGHTLGNLAEEYLPATIPKGSKNCVKKCEDFPQEPNAIDGCYEGCSKSDYFRSIENGVMRTLNSNEYGIFNTGLIQEKINKEKSSITGNAISDSNNKCSNQQFYLIKGKVKDNKLSTSEKTLETGCAPKQGSGEYYYSIIKGGNQIASSDFNPSLIYTDVQSETENQIDGETYLQDEFYLAIPKIENTDEIQILNNDKEIQEIINLNELTSYPCKIQ